MASISVMTEQENPDLWASLEREGLRWVDLLTSGVATAADLKALKHWREKSPVYAKALREAIALRRVSTQLRPEDVGIYTNQAAQSGTQHPSVHRRAMLGGGLATAGVAAAACYSVVYPPLNLWPSLAELSADYRTAKGEQRKIELTKDVSITLNTLTSVSNGSGSGRRAIRLIDGEVAANVTGASNLEVLAMDGKAIARDAKFDVRHDNGLVRVTCSAGSVQVECGSQSVTIKSGQQVSYDASKMNAITVTDLAVATAWSKGFLVLSGTSLKDAVAEINRYRSGRIIIANANLERRQIDLLLSIKNLDNAVPLIRRATGAHVTTVGDYAVLT